MRKADYLKAARNAGDILSQIAWLNDQTPSWNDDKAWAAWEKALDTLYKEASLLVKQIDALKEKAAELEAAGGRLRDAFYSAECNAYDTIRDAGESHTTLENQLWLYTMATNEDTIRELMYNE